MTDSKCTLRAEPALHLLRQLLPRDCLPSNSRGMYLASCRGTLPAGRIVSGGPKGITVWNAAGLRLWAEGRWPEGVREAVAISRFIGLVSEAGFRVEFSKRDNGATHEIRLFCRSHEALCVWGRTWSEATEDATAALTDWIAENAEEDDPNLSETP